MAGTILFCTRCSPIPGEQGSASYLFSMAQCLSRNGYKVVVAWCETPPKLQRDGVMRVPRKVRDVFCLKIRDGFSLGAWIVNPRAKWLPFKARVLSFAKCVLQRLKVFEWINRVCGRKPTSSSEQASRVSTQPLPGWHDVPRDYERAFFERVISRLKPDLIIASYCWINAGLDRIAQSLGLPPRMVLTYDVQHQEIALENGGLIFRPKKPIDRETERTWLKSADVILSISDRDAATFRELLPDHEVITVPMPAKYQPLPRDRIVGGRCLFVGSDAYFNRNSLEWFLNGVWPLIREARADACLHICGTVCRHFSDQPVQGIVCRGRVDDLEEEYAQTAVVVLPILEGSGIKTKLIEAVQYGRSCVSTSVGLYGLDALKGSVLKADDEEAFVAGVLALFSETDGQSKRKSCAREVLENRFNSDRTIGPLLHKVAEVIRLEREFRLDGSAP